jgi:hypothetical protein
MNPYELPTPICCACDRDHDLHIFMHNRTSTPIVFCTTCAAHEMMRGNAKYEYTYQGRYLGIAERVTDRYLAEHDNARRMAESMQEPYDEAMATYEREIAGYTAQQMHDRRADTLELDTLYDMPSDAVLDKYIDANPDKFPESVYNPGNTEDMQLAGLRQWHDLRQSAIGG